MVKRERPVRCTGKPGDRRIASSEDDNKRDRRERQYAGADREVAEALPEGRIEVRVLCRRGEGAIGREEQDDVNDEAERN